MQTTDVVIRLATLEGKFEVCGVDRLRGIVPDPDSILYDHDQWGPRSCGFILRRDPRADHPDLSAFTPCKIEVGGVPVWSGRVRETPSRDGDDRQITVQGEGWQYHLDDDTFQRAYVHTRLSEYRDSRTFPTQQLSNFTTVGTVASDDGMVTVGWPNGSIIPASASVGVTLDLGIACAGRRIVVRWEHSNNDSNATFYLRGHAVENVHQVGYSDAATITLTGGAAGTSAGTFAADKRYIHLFLYHATGGTNAADKWFKIIEVKVFASTAYETANISILQADDVVRDARDQATMLLSPSNDLIPTNDSIFNIPDFVLDGDHTSREVIQAVNAYEDNECAVDVEKRLVFRNKASRPVLEVGEWAGAEFSDASMNSGQDIYNHVVVQGQGPDGAPMRIERYTADLAGTAVIPLTSPSNSNSSFATNTTGWGHNVGAFTRTTTPGEFDSSPAGAYADVAAAGGYYIQSPFYTGTFEAGRTYKLTVWLSLGSDITGVTLKFGQDTDVATKELQWVSLPLTTTHSITWTPTGDRTAVALRVEFYTDQPASQAIFIDSLNLFEARNATLVDRRGFRRTKILPVRSALTAGMANQIGDTFLRGHQVTPFKGDLTVTGQGGVRRGLGGQAVHPAHLGLEVNQLIRFSDRVNPDTGGWGRSGRIVAVSYKHADQQASVSLDSTSGNLEALLARLDVVSGQVR